MIHQRLRMLKTVLIVQHQQKQQQHHQKEIVVIEVHVMDVEEVEIVHGVLMVLHRKKVEKIELQQQQLLINKLMMHIQITTHIIVCTYLSFLLTINHIFFLLQIMIIQVKVVMELHGIVINKINEKKKVKEHLVLIRMYQLETQQVNHLSNSISFLYNPFFFLTDGSDIPDTTNSHESTIKRDVHNFIFDDEAVVVDDCSFVLPYIEGAYYYQSTTPPPATDIPLTNIDVNTDDYSLPLVPAYTEQQLKELLRRQV